MLSRLSPSTLYGESILALLDPTTRTLGPLYLSQLHANQANENRPAGGQSFDHRCGDRGDGAGSDTCRSRRKPNATGAEHA
jgi:hypothetical protein